MTQNSDVLKIASAASGAMTEQACREMLTTLVGIRKSVQSRYSISQRKFTEAESEMQDQSKILSFVMAFGDILNQRLAHIEAEKEKST